MDDEDQLPVPVVDDVRPLRDDDRAAQEQRRQRDLILARRAQRESKQSHLFLYLLQLYFAAPTVESMYDIISLKLS